MLVFKLPRQRPGGVIMKLNLEKLICDNCDKEVTLVKPTFGISPFAGWITVSLENNGLSQQVATCHLCCKTCAIEFLEGLE